MSTLKSITVYEGRFILEYSRDVQGKTAGSFVIENPPGDPLPAGDSLNEAKRVIDGLAGRSAACPSLPGESASRAACEGSGTAVLQHPVPDSGGLAEAGTCPPYAMRAVDESILNALRDRVSQDDGSVRRIARFLSVHSGVILEWLAGRRKPRQATLERIAAYLKGPVIRA
ncbi:MAG: hypothetical protein JO015_21510 [Verrucomicrobia bacterium]|nr:hypothetical protein [Verrucomicrobiota bacterium]